jgi:predicted nucleic acid-binding protein
MILFARILDLVLEDELILLTCPGIVDEYREVMGRLKFKRFGCFPGTLPATFLTLSRHLPASREGLLA